MPAIVAALPVAGVGAFEWPAALDIVLGRSCCMRGVCEFQRESVIAAWASVGSRSHNLLKFMSETGACVSMSNCRKSVFLSLIVEN